jgi:excisionase family DNA binding protein
MTDIHTHIRLLSVKQTAGTLGLSQEYVRRLLREGKLRGHKFGADWRIPGWEVQRVILGGLDGPPIQAQPFAEATL